MGLTHAYSPMKKEQFQDREPYAIPDTVCLCYSTPLCSASGIFQGIMVLLMAIRESRRDIGGVDWTGMEGQKSAVTGFVGL